MEDGQNAVNEQLQKGLIMLVAGTVFCVTGILLWLAFAGQVHADAWKKGTISNTPAFAQGIFLAEVDSNGRHIPTGLVYAPGIMEVRRNCTACHSPKLIAQTAATREGWMQIISWMQRTQGLWDLGDDREKILDYLATHYAPESQGRRANLDAGSLHWYVLEE